MTPAANNALEDLRLAAKARLLLAQDERTYSSNFKVRADKRIVTVTFLPQDASLSSIVQEVLASLQGIERIQTTLATSSILWIQQNYDVHSEAFRNVAEIALKWDAAVELLRLSGEAGEEVTESVESFSAEAADKEAKQKEYDGGIEDDEEHMVQDDDGGMKNAIEELSKMGRSGGGRTVSGAQEHLLDALNPKIPYTMVVVGDLFLSKGHAARVRMQRELKSLLSDKIKAPVVGTDELKPQFLFSKRDLFRLVGYLALVALIYFLVFTHQMQVLTFLSLPGWKAKVLAAVAVFLFAPLVAYFYGVFSKIFLKLIKIE
jgi:hypothetical protein